MKIDQKQRHDLMGNEKDNTIPEHEYGKLNIHDFFIKKKKERKKERLAQKHGFKNHYDTPMVWPQCV